MILNGCACGTGPAGHFCRGRQLPSAQDVAYPDQVLARSSNSPAAASASRRAARDVMPSPARARRRRPAAAAWLRPHRRRPDHWQQPMATVISLPYECRCRPPAGAVGPGCRSPSASPPGRGDNEGRGEGRPSCSVRLGRPSPALRGQRFACPGNRACGARGPAAVQLAFYGSQLTEALAISGVVRLFVTRCHLLGVLS